MGRRPDIILLAKESGSFEYIDISLEEGEVWIIFQFLLDPMMN